MIYLQLTLALALPVWGAHSCLNPLVAQLYHDGAYLERASHSRLTALYSQESNYDQLNLRQLWHYISQLEAILDLQACRLEHFAPGYRQLWATLLRDCNQEPVRPAGWYRHVDKFHTHKVHLQLKWLMKTTPRAAHLDFDWLLDNSDSLTETYKTIFQAWDAPIGILNIVARRPLTTLPQIHSIHSCYSYQYLRLFYQNLFVFATDYTPFVLLGTQNEHENYVCLADSFFCMLADERTEEDGDDGASYLEGQGLGLSFV